MAADSFLARLGLRVATLGSAASLAYAAPISEGNVSATAHTHAGRTGWYHPTSTSMGVVINGAEALRYWSDGGVQIGGTYSASPGAAALQVGGLTRVGGNVVFFGGSSSLLYQTGTTLSISAASGNTPAATQGRASFGPTSVYVGMDSGLANTGVLISSGTPEILAQLGNTDPRLAIRTTGVVVERGGLVVGGQGSTGTITLKQSGGGDYLSIQANAGAGGTLATWTLPVNNGSAGYVLSTNGSGALSWIAITSTPAAPANSIQFNNAGSFGGNASWTCTPYLGIPYVKLNPSALSTGLVNALFEASWTLDASSIQSTEQAAAMFKTYRDPMYVASESGLRYRGIFVEVYDEVDADPGFNPGPSTVCGIESRVTEDYEAGIGSRVISNMTAIKAQANTYTAAGGALNLTNLIGLHVEVSLGGGGSTNITTLYGVLIDDYVSSGSPTVTNRYGLYQVNPLSKNYFAGQVQVDGQLRSTAAFQTGITLVTGSTVLDATHQTVLVNASGGPVTITVPAASTITGRRYDIKKTDNSANAVTIVRTGSDLLDGATSISLTVQYQSRTLIAYGATNTWNVL